MVLVSVYDSKAETYTSPHASANQQTAIRDFATVVNDGGKNMISQHPEDFSLFQVGEFFERVPVGEDGKTTAKLVASPAFVCLAQAIDLVNKD